MSDSSIHDNIVYGFTVACDERRLVLHTRFQDCKVQEYTDVVFAGLAAHHFEDVLAANILFSIDEVGVDHVVKEWSGRFDHGKNYAWPDQIEYRDAEHLVMLLRQRAVKAFVISSSFGLSGFILAATMELRPRVAEAVLT